MARVEDEYDVAVVGAGFGGIAAGLELARRGARVAIFERLKYPGGCASTFTRRGYQFESGATLFSGFGTGQLFSRWIEELGLDVEFTPMDPIVELRAASFELKISADRERLIAQFLGMGGADPDSLRAFFEIQKTVADALWPLFDRPGRLPPFSASELGFHLQRLGHYARILPHVGRPLTALLQRLGLAEFEPLRTYLDAVCQITVQASSSEVESPFALSAMDYFFRGTGHVRGGVGKLAHALTDALAQQGGHVYMADGVEGLEHDGNFWTVTSRRRTLRARYVVANLLPRALSEMVGRSTRRLDRMSSRVQDGWGAAMLYRVFDRDVIETPGPHHLELVADSSSAFTEGNHVFVSISGADEVARAPNGQRTATVSTHVPMQTLLSLEEPDRATYISEVQGRMRETIKRRAPELAQGIELEMPASPRTFERFTARPDGFVGGIPRRAGLAHYLEVLPTPIWQRLYMVGDTVFPGQSTLATAVGGVKVADAIAARARL